MDRYVVIDSTGMVVNVVLWDGVAEWSPPEGCTAALEDSDEGRAAMAASGAEPAPEQHAGE